MKTSEEEPGSRFSPQCGCSHTGLVTLRLCSDSVDTHKPRRGETRLASLNSDLELVYDRGSVNINNNKQKKRKVVAVQSLSEYKLSPGEFDMKVLKFTSSCFLNSTSICLFLGWFLPMLWPVMKLLLM